MAEVELITQVDENLRPGRLDMLEEKLGEHRRRAARSRARAAAFWQERIDAAIRALEEYEEQT
jgi:hypothetical protein